MAKQSIDLRDELRSYRFEFDVFQKIPCKKQENKEYAKLLKEGGSLPEGVHPYIYQNGDISTSEFYTVHGTDLSKSEVSEYLTYRRLSYIRTIKNCAVYFTTISVISGIIGILYILSILH